jgi:hypothetical protein
MGKSLFLEYDHYFMSLYKPVGCGCLGFLPVPVPNYTLADLPTFLFSVIKKYSFDCIFFFINIL